MPRKRPPQHVAAFRLGAGYDLHGKIGREFLAFRGPVVDERCRADDERRAIPLTRLDKGKQLHGFAQAHLIGENATESLVP